jgi:hypothetical protein
VRNSDANKNGVSSQKRITFEEAKTMVHRLSERMAIKTVRPEARDYEDWKRKHNIQPGQPVFCITGNYPLIQDVLLKRGWYLNEDSESIFFDLKWSLSSAGIDYAELLPNQMVNHFRNAGVVTTKVGLLHTLGSLRFFANRDEDSIFPRCYDMSSKYEVKAFIDDFSFLMADSLLKRLIYKFEKVCSLAINPGTFEVLLSILRRRIGASCSDVIDDPQSCAISKAENHILFHAAVWLYNAVPIKEVEEMLCFGNCALTATDAFLKLDDAMIDKTNISVKTVG